METKIRTFDGYTTDFLIINEDNIDWEYASFHSVRELSLAEIKLFRSKINWDAYILSHDLNPVKMEFASKYFTRETYQRIAAFNMATEEFILKNKEKFNWLTLIKNSKLSEETLLAAAELWQQKSLKDIKDAFLTAKYIDINSGAYPAIQLYLNLI